MTRDLMGDLRSSSTIYDFFSFSILNKLKEHRKKEKEDIKNVRRFKIIALNTQHIENATKLVC